MARTTTTTSPGAGVVVVRVDDRRTAVRPERKRFLRSKSNVSYLPPLVGKTAEQLEAEAEAKRTGATFYRLRRQLAPWYIALGLGAAATASWTAGVWLEPTHIAATIGATATGLGALTWRQVRGSIPERRSRYPLRRRVGQAGLAGAAWLTAAAATGPTWTSAAALTAGTVALSVGWWKANRIPAPTAAPKVAKVAEEPARALNADWDDYVACPTGPVPGSRLYGREEIDHGEAWSCLLNRTGRQTLSTMLGSLEQISTNLNIPLDQIVIEPHPSKQPALISVKIVETTPMSDENVAFTGPTIGDWLVPVGPYADGDGDYLWRFWEDGGTGAPSDGSAWSGFICGGTGMGKSRLMENLAINVVSTGQAVVWFIDGQSGGSSPDLMAYADWYVELADAKKVREAIERVMFWRSQENSANGWKGFTPSPDRPLLVVFIDECHLVFAGKEAKAWNDIARMCRKVGISLVAASQQADLTSFGGHAGLRDAIMTGNGLCMRTQSQQNGQLLTGLPVDPTTLPRIPGYAYACDSPVARSAPWRNRLVRNAAEWFARFTQPRLDPLSLKAAGTAYLDRSTSPDEVRGATRATIEAFLAGPTPDEPITQVNSPEVVGELEVVDFPDWNTVVAQVEAEEGSVGQMPESWRKVLDALTDGHTTKADLMGATGSPESTVRTALNGLKAAGMVTQPGRGRYELTARRVAS